MHIHSIPSPNCDARANQTVDMLVLHYTGMKDGPRAIDRLIDPNSQVSAHYVVDENGAVYQLVDESMRAWHAGKSYWRGHTNINQRSIGVEIVNPGHEFGYRPFPKMQMQSVIQLCQAIVARHNIAPQNIVAHSDIAPTRKIDPGELFDWKMLAEAGIGLWAEPSNSHGGANIQPAAALRKFGYDITDAKAAIKAFQRHFCPDNLTGVWSERCGLTLQALLNNVSH